ncbi:DNA-directed RNA polymerases I and III subunit RPAC2-like isoform 1-T1 [Chlamydotis macqueenii]
MAMHFTLAGLQAPCSPLCQWERRRAEHQDSRTGETSVSVQADGTDGNCVTFVLHDEDHTLGNSLRYMVMKNPDVEFCGYCITHPSESKINFRIQTRGALPAVEPFRKGLNDLMGVCQHVLSTFERSVKEYRAQREEEMQ